MAVSYNSASSRVDLSITFTDISGKTQTIHYLLNSIAADGHTVLSDGSIGLFLDGLDNASNAYISRVSTILLPTVTGQKASATVNNPAPPDASFPYVKEYGILTFAAVSDRTTSGRVALQTVVIPAPNNITDANGGAIDTAGPGMAELLQQYQAFGTTKLGYVAGSQSYATHGMQFLPARSGFSENGATTINA